MMIRDHGQQVIGYRSVRRERAAVHGPERRQAERRQARRFRWQEQRTGFDKRRPTGRPIALAFSRLAAGLRQRPSLLVQILLLFNLYNVADYVLTLNALQAGHRELNPVMGYLFAVDPLLAGGFKLASGLAVTALIWRFRAYRRILQFSVFAYALYLLLIAYHLYGSVTMNV